MSENDPKKSDVILFVRRVVANDGASDKIDPQKKQKIHASLKNERRESSVRAGFELIEREFGEKIGGEI